MKKNWNFTCVRLEPLFGLSHLHASAFKIRLFAFPSEISQWIFIKIHCENAEFGSLRDPGLLQVFNLQQPRR